MNSYLGRLFSLVVFVTATIPAWATVTFSVSPDTISNTYVGFFTVQVNGLTNGEPVILQNYADFNGDGIVDTGDMLMEQYQLTDGQRATIGGITNLNVPGDFTPADGAITCYLPYVSPRPQLGMGTHLIRLASPTDHFAPLTNPVTITNWPFPQTISGTVSNSSSSVPNAVIVILSAAPDLDGRMVAEAVADGTGHYSVHLPVGDYQLLAFQRGYVYSAATAPMVSLTNNDTQTANLTLSPATQTLSGTMADSVNTNLPVRGLFTVFQSASGLITVGGTDSNGQFNVPLVPDGWQMEALSDGLPPLGYVVPQSPPMFDTTSGSVSNTLVTFIRATAMIYGTIRDASSTPLPGISFYGNNDDYTLESDGLSDLAGHYSVAVTPGAWWAGPDNEALSNSLVGGTDLRTLTNGQAVQQDLVVVPATTTIHGTVRDAQGQPVVGLSVWTATQQGSINFNSGSDTDTNGNFSLSVFNGSWNVGLNCSGNSGLEAFGYDCNLTSYQMVTIPPANPTVNFTVYPLGTPQLDAPQFIGPGQFYFNLHGQPGTNYVVQFTTNLADPLGWNTLTTISPTNIVQTVFDNHATNGVRFYRARIWP